jgi:phosphoglycerol transferase MdoB-like AlkP superfamily enzyme
MSAPVKDDAAFYSRINQFGEYKINSSLNTLFILQVTFIVVLIFIALYYLHFYGLFSKGSLYIVTVILTVLLILIILNKAVVLPRIRSKAVWDQYNFGDRTLNPTTPYTIKGVEGGAGGTTRSEVCTTSCSSSADSF